MITAVRREALVRLRRRVMYGVRFLLVQALLLGAVELAAYYNYLNLETWDWESAVNAFISGEFSSELSGGDMGVVSPVNIGGSSKTQPEVQPQPQPREETLKERSTRKSMEGLLSQLDVQVELQTGNFDIMDAGGV